MTKLSLRLPDAAAVGKRVQTNTHDDHQAAAGQCMPSSSSNPPSAVVGNQGAGAGHAAVGVKPRRIRKKVQALGRNRASPARLVKLNALLSDDQKALIIEWAWGGMLEVKATVMPVDLSMWLLSCFDPVRSELVIPGRGSITVDAESYHRVFGLQNEGSHVRFELDAEAIAFMNEEYGIEDAMAPSFKEWCEMIRRMNGVADLKFLRAYFAAVISCFICPTTKCSISPRCYGVIKNLEQARQPNICKLAIDQIITEVKKMGAKKNSVCCCLYHLVILYLDSLEVDEPIEPASACPIRAAAWTNQLIHAVIQKDRKPNGQFGKLRLKEGIGANVRDSLFVGMTQTEDFVSSKLSSNISSEKKRKIAVLLGDLCTDISHRLGTFVEEYGALIQDDTSVSDIRNRNSKRQRTENTDEFDEDLDDKNEDDEVPDDDDTESADDSSESNDNDEADAQGNFADNTRQPTNTPEETNQDDGDNSCDLQHRPRRSARLAKSSPMKGCSEGNSHGSTGNTSRCHDGGTNQGTDDDITLSCLLRSARKTLKKDNICTGSTSVTAEGNGSSSQRSPFSELKKYTMSDPTRGNSDFNMPYIEHHEFFDTPIKMRANIILMEELQRQTPVSLPEFQQFGDDFAVRKVAEECFAMEREKILGKGSVQDTKRQKAVAHRDKQTNTTSPEKIQKAALQTAPVQDVANAVLQLKQLEASLVAESTETLQSLDCAAIQKKTHAPNHGHKEVQTLATSATVTTEQTCQRELRQQPRKEPLKHQVRLARLKLPIQTADLRDSNGDLTLPVPTLPKGVGPHQTANLQAPAQIASKLEPKAREATTRTMLDSTLSVPKHNLKTARQLQIPALLVPKPATNKVQPATKKLKVTPLTVPKPPTRDTTKLQIPSTIVAEPVPSKVQKQSTLQKKHSEAVCLNVSHPNLTTNIGATLNTESTTAAAGIANPARTDTTDIPVTAVSTIALATKDTTTITMQSNQNCPVATSAHQVEPPVVTRTTCPPPEPITEAKGGEGYCDAPSFSLGFDSPQKKGCEMETEPGTLSVLKPVDLNASRFVGDDIWTPAMIKEACDACDRIEIQKGYVRQQVPVQQAEGPSEVQIQTPTKVQPDVELNTGGTSSTTGPPVKQAAERRIIRQAPWKRSPYVDYSNKNSFLCSAEVKQVYDAVVVHGRRSTRGQSTDTTPITVNYERFYVTLQELANSMMPGACLKNSVFELGVESIMLRTDRRMKKVVMPLRVSEIILTEMDWRNKELIKYFSKTEAHLDRKETIVIPVMEDLAPAEAKVAVNHYWLLVVNVRDKRFELLDSMRTKADKRLDSCAKKLIAIIRCLWDEHYKGSHITLDNFGYEDIAPPKQINTHDCGVHALYNAEFWFGRSLPSYEGANMPNIRKLMTHTWVSSEFNDVDWKSVLKIK